MIKSMGCSKEMRNYFVTPQNLKLLQKQVKKENEAKLFNNLLDRVFVLCEIILENWTIGNT
jgi:hypothetical protein